MPSHRLGAGVVVVEGGAVLLVRNRGLWSLPNGSSREKEPLAATARREPWEETGLDVDVREVAFIREGHGSSNVQWWRDS